MLRIFMEEKVFSALMLACMVISIFLRLLLGFLYRKMIKEADNMAITDNKMLKQCKLKFANCYQLGNGVANIPVFVDKFLNRLSLGPLSFEMMYHLSGQAILLSVVFAGVGICRCILKGWTLGAILPFYIISFMGLYLYFSVSTVVDVRGKKRILKVNLVDYLENHLSPRIDVTRADMEMLYGDTYVYQDASCEAMGYGPVRGRGYGYGAGYGDGYGGEPVSSRAAISPRAGKRRGTKAASEARQLPGGKESRSARKARAKAGVPERRTVQLMPIGNRLAAPGREILPEMDIEENQDREVRGQMQAQTENYDRQRTVVQDREGAYTAQGEGAEPEKAWFMEDPEQGRMGSPDRAEGPGSSPENSAEVTEEELEALLKEFLTT